jgi:hypothetical protein
MSVSYVWRAEQASNLRPPVRIPADEPPPPPAPPQPSDDELEVERDMEYFVEPDEALAPRTGDGGRCPGRGLVRAVGDLTAYRDPLQ